MEELLKLNAQYMTLMIEQREEIGMLKERLLWLERRCGFSTERGRGCKLLKMEISRKRTER